MDQLWNSSIYFKCLKLQNDEKKKQDRKLQSGATNLIKMYPYFTATGYQIFLLILRGGTSKEVCIQNLETLVLKCFYDLSTLPDERVSISNL